MIWTKEAPDMDGIYLFRYNEEGSLCFDIIHFIEGCVFYFGTKHYRLITDDCFKDVEWCGPIELSELLK